MAKLALAVVLCAGCATRAGNPASPRPPRASPPIACPDAASIVELEVPRFAIADPPPLAASLGDDIVMIRVGRLGPGAALASTSTQPFHGAIYDARAARWADLPPPPRALGAGVQHQLRVVGGRVVLLYAGHDIDSTPTRGALVYDPRARAWTDVSAGAPPLEAFRTRPFREATAGDRWVWFPQSLSLRQALAREARFGEGARRSRAGGVFEDPSETQAEPHAYVLDVAAGRWLSATPRGMPRTPITFFVRALPSGRVLVPDAEEDVAGLYDPVADRWERVPFVRLDADFSSVAVAPDGTIAVLSFGDPDNGARPVRAWIADPRARTITPLPPTTSSATPNAELVHYDGARIVYLDPEQWHRYAGGRWTHGPLPVPVHSGGALRPACGGRAHLVADHHWLLEPEAMSFRRVAWREDIPALGHVTLYDPRYVAILGEVREESYPRSCPPGAPCLPPETERVESPRAFLVPLR